MVPFEKIKIEHLRMAASWQGIKWRFSDSLIWIHCRLFLHAYNNSGHMMVSNVSINNMYLCRKLTDIVVRMSAHILRCWWDCFFCLFVLWNGYVTQQQTSKGRNLKLFRVMIYFKFGYLFSYVVPQSCVCKLSCFFLTIPAFLFPRKCIWELCMLFVEGTNCFAFANIRTA